jgi:hypothetical protein
MMSNLRPGRALIRYSDGMGANKYLSWQRLTRTTFAAMLMMVAAVSYAGNEGQVRATPSHRLSSLELSVQRLSTGLHLTQQQQEQLRVLLEQQHDRIGHVWSDPELSAAERIATTRQISHRTADAIRALLDDTQRKLYNAPSRDKTPMAARTIDEWMRLAAGPPDSTTTAAGTPFRPGSP